MPKINLNRGHLKSLKNGPFVYVANSFIYQIDVNPLILNT